MLCSFGIPGRTTFFLKGNGGGMDLVEKGSEGLWEEWKDRKLQLGCIMWEKNTEKITVGVILQTSPVPYLVNLLVPPFCKWTHLRLLVSSVLHFSIVPEARLAVGNGALSLFRECGTKEVILIEFLLFLARPLPSHWRIKPTFLP